MVKTVLHKKLLRDMRHSAMQFIALMVLCVLTGAVVILCSMIAQTINQRIDPRQRASQGEVTAL